MNSKQFNTLYNDSGFNRRIKSLANRYYNSYAKTFDTLILDRDDVEQEIWIDIYEGDYNKKPIIMKQAIQKLYDMLRAGNADIRAVDDVDLNNLAYENENGEIETDDEVMARLVYSGRGRYV